LAGISFSSNYLHVGHFADVVYKEMKSMLQVRVDIANNNSHLFD